MTGVTVNLTGGTATATGGVSNILNVTGSPANDTITGNSASNVINGNGGTDVLNGGGGGSDLFILEESAPGLGYDRHRRDDRHAAGRQRGQHVDHHRCQRGERQRDRVHGHRRPDRRHRSGRIRYVRGETISARSMAEAATTDWLDYAAYTTPMTVNLATNTATGIDGGVAGGIANIRNVRGGQGGDTLTGNSLGNVLIGGSGNDTITGGSSHQHPDRRQGAPTPSGAARVTTSSSAAPLTTTAAATSTTRH